MKLMKINIPRDRLLKNKGNLKLKNINNVELSDKEAGKIADILAQKEGISLMHKERQASLLCLNHNEGTTNA